MQAPALPQQDLADFQARYPEARTLDAILPDMNHVYRGKRLALSELPKVLSQGLAMPGPIITVDQLGFSNDPGGLGVSDGDPDLPLYAVPGSLAPIPWRSTAADAQILLSFVDPQGRGGYPHDPRWFLVQAIERLKALGLTAVVAFELEFYLLSPERPAGSIALAPVEESQGPDVYRMSLLDAYEPALSDMIRACAAQGLDAGAVTKEFAPGQFEINLHHQADVLRAADHCGLFRRLVKGCARDAGLRATFMSKPFLQQSGSGMHIHVSLLDQDGRNVFDDGSDQGSPLLRQAIAGALATLPEAMAAYAWTPHAYRRFLADIFVPVTPTWGYENRAAAIRVPFAGGQARRFEFRVPGAEANPHLALACLLASIAHGLEGKLEAPAPSVGNVGAVKSPDLPWSLCAALERMQQATILPAAFGAASWDLIREAKALEVDNFQAAITAREYDWYLHHDA